MYYVIICLQNLTSVISENYSVTVSCAALIVTCHLRRKSPHLLFTLFMKFMIYSCIKMIRVYDHADGGETTCLNWPSTGPLFIHQSSLAVLPAELSGGKKEWVKRMGT
jgi:hypothetical protein